MAGTGCIAGGTDRYLIAQPGKQIQLVANNLLQKATTDASGPASGGKEVVYPSLGRTVDAL